MQETSFIVTIFFLVIALVVVIAVLKRFRRPRTDRDKTFDKSQMVIEPTIEDTSSTPIVSDPSTSLQEPPSLPESDNVIDQLRNEEEPIDQNNIPSSSDTTISTSIEHEPERKEEKTEAISAVVDKPESNITGTAIELTESEPDIPVATDNVPAVEEAQTNDTMPPSKQTKLSPIDRVGRPRGPGCGSKNSKNKPDTKSVHIRKPEVVCWQQYRKWFLGIEIPDNSDLFDLAILQGNEKLSKTTDERWMLSSIDSNIEFSSSSLEQKTQIRLAEKDNPYLLFKLTGQNQKWGRRVRYATTGTFLVVVPEMWTRNEELSGVPQVQPEQCHLAGFRAHFFNLDSETDNNIAFLTSEGKPIKIPNRLSQFELVGPLIEDANEAMGPLFGASLPKLRCREGLDWENITTVVIGEEGENHSGWRTSFIPNREVAIQDLGESLQARQSGWYFIRLYDTNEDLIESLDFRFALTLENIVIAPHSALPGKQGHAVVRIEIHHANNSSIRLVRPLDIQLHTNVNDRGTIVDVPPNPNSDKTDWNLLTEKNPKVDLSFLVERVWWSIGEQDATAQQNSWKDKSIVLSPLHFVATSKHSLRIRFPRRRWTKEVHVGFEQWRARAYRVEVTRQEVEIPLNHFEGASECEDSSKDHPLKLWINNLAEQTIAILPHRSDTAKKQIRPKRSILIRLNKKRLLKYLSRLDHTAKNPTFSEMLKECKQNWLSSDVKEKRDDYLIRTACLIKMCWEIMKSRGMKPIGRRRGWVRTLIKVAEAHPDHLANITDKYEMLIRNDEDSTLLSARTNTR
ncbi:MAG: hypothetical protein Q8K98_08810 [Bacteroidota bacterium]|nr:hypothetical protein [Bacteroidota bacterium]